jgi:phage gp29-like protein
MTTLYDMYNQPIDFKRLKQEEAGPTVTGVRNPFGAHPEDGLTPAKLGRLLKDSEAGDPTAYLELAEAMEEKDPHYRSVLATRRMQVASLEVTVAAATDDKADLAAADLLREWLARDTLQSELFDLLDAVGKGFAVAEIDWETTGKRWMPRALVWRDPRWFRFDADGTTLRLLGEGGQLVPLAPWKFVRHVHKTKSGLPIRGGLARVAAWGYLFKNFDLKSWVAFAEGFGRPTRLGKYHAGATEADKQVLLKAVRSIASDAAAIIPESMAIDLVEAKITGNVQLFESLAGYLDRAVSKAVLGQTGTTDVGQHVGTADAHERVREDIEAWDAMLLATTLNRDLARPIVDLNLGPRDRYPRLVIKRPDEDDLDKMAERLAKLVPLGLRIGASTVRDKLGFPDPDEGEEVLAVQGAAPTTPAPTPAEQAKALGGRGEPARAGVSPRSHDSGGHPRGLRGVSPAIKSMARDAADTADAVDRLIADLAEGGELEQAFAPVLDGVVDLVEGAGSYEELRAALAPGLAGLNSDRLADLLARAMFAARLAGMVEE